LHRKNLLLWLSRSLSLQKKSAKPLAKQTAKPAAKPIVAAPTKPVAVPVAKPIQTPAPQANKAVEDANDDENTITTQPQPIKTTTTKTVVKKDPSMADVRYSDKDLKEFEELIQEKLKAARSDMDELKQSLSHEGDNSTDDTAPTFKMMEDGSETMNREELSQLASRQEKFIQNLENALLRIKNKTYGICRVTGKLIPKERLRLVPHATLSIEAKNMQ
jgi:DnaK suppressor protein